MLGRILYKSHVKNLLSPVPDQPSMVVFRNVQLVNSYILTYMGHVPPDVRNQSELPLTAEHLMLVLKSIRACNIVSIHTYAKTIRTLLVQWRPSRFENIDIDYLIRSSREIREHQVRK